MDDRAILEKFLRMGLSFPGSVLQEFTCLENAMYYRETLGSDDFVYVSGTRKDRVLLVAHADTVFLDSRRRHQIICEDGIYRSNDPSVGIGADDRAGCAIVYLLRDLGHSLLITNGEEIGRLGAKTIKRRHPKLYAELNKHQYILEFDLRNNYDYKVYNIPVSREFRSFIETNTGYKEAGKRSFTDITVLCNEICGANLSIGYYDEHTPFEKLVYSEWENTLNTARKMLTDEQKKFPAVRNQ